MCSGYREIVAPWPVPNHTSKKDLVHFYGLVTLDVCLQQFFTQPEQYLAVSCGKNGQIRHLSCLPCQTPHRNWNLSDTFSMISTFFTIFANNIEHRTSRGQVTRLLQVPFLRGPSGRKSIQFVGAILWNMLPLLARSIQDPLLFKQSTSTFDFTAVEIISNIPMFNLL